jgi:quercetin dioxygenase-like cupin family protein
MATAGQTVLNPVTKERITFLETAADTDGERVTILLGLDPKGAVPGTHVHPEQYETFHVIEGKMKFRLGLKKVVAGPGETVVVPPGAIHNFANAGDTEALVRVVIEPALDMEQLFETAIELAIEGKTTHKGMPKPLHLALFTRRFAREVRAPFPPAWMVRALMAPLAAIGRWRGHAERYVTPATA